MCDLPRASTIEPTISTPRATCRVRALDDGVVVGSACSLRWLPWLGVPADFRGASVVYRWRDLVSMPVAIEDVAALLVHSGLGYASRFLLICGIYCLRGGQLGLRRDGVLRGLVAARQLPLQSVISRW